MKAAYQMKLVATKEFVEMLEKEVAARDQGLQSSGKSIGRNVERMATVAAPLSLVMLIFGFAGFYLWWSNVQSVQDKILDCEYAKLKRDLAAPDAVGGSVHDKSTLTEAN